MKRIILSMLLFTVAAYGFSQNYDTSGTGSQASQPTVMVMPDVNSKLSGNPENLRSYLESNPMLELCISRVKEAFTLKSYPVRDFAKALSALKTDALLSADQSAATDVAKQIVQSSDADICIYVKPKVINHAGGLSEVIVELDAQEAKLSNSFANASFSSDKFRTSDSIKLASRAMDCISNNFFYQIEEGFHQMVVDGRTMRFKIEFAEGCDIDAYTEVGTNGNDLETELTDWILANAYNKNGRVTGSSDKYINMEMKVPVYEESTGRPFPINRMRGILLRSLRQWLTPLGCKAKTVASRDQVMNFLITNSEE